MTSSQPEIRTTQRNYDLEPAKLRTTHASGGAAGRQHDQTGSDSAARPQSGTPPQTTQDHDIRTASTSRRQPRRSRSGTRHGLKPTRNLDTQQNYDVEPAKHRAATASGGATDRQHDQMAGLSR
ncbi:hypothetical protein GCM10027088_36960 [Nocardia goodfellowii]